MKKVFVAFVLFTLAFGIHEASAQTGLSASAAPISLGRAVEVQALKVGWVSV